MWCRIEEGGRRLKRKKERSYRAKTGGQAMNDATTSKPLQVSTDGTAGPYIILPVSQLAELCELLDSHGVDYSVEENFISFNGAPETAVVDFGRNADARAIQAILDGGR
jgi:hypothetical protein